MKFYDREEEQKEFKRILNLSKTTAQMTLVLGRRRVGKTALLKKIYEKQKELYFFVSRKSEPLLCKEYCEEIKKNLNVQIYGEINSFKELFSFLLDVSKKTPFTLIIDEFQEFFNINPSIYSDMQNVWDSNKNICKINLVLCGSIYSLMKKIFENEKEPLFSRQNQKIIIKEFSNKTLKTILKDYNPKYKNEDLLAFYLFTGGIAKYVEIFVENKAFTKQKMIDLIFKPNSFFIDEGKNVLIDEFGKDYGIYFSILSLIASSKTSRSEIESILNVSVGGYLDKLENDFSLVQKIRPVFASANSRNVKYRIVDNFLSFWFRFIFKYSSAIEIGNLDYVKEILLRDYNMYSGIILERYFRRYYEESKLYNIVGNYWESDNSNEIDIVAVNEMNKKVQFVEVKRNKDKIDIAKLKEKSKKLLPQFDKYSIEYKGLSLEDM